MSAYRHKYNLKRFFKMTLEDYNLMLEKQGHKCAICGGSDKDRRLCVDHCHKTGKIRGLLCINCNTVLGKTNDDTSLLEKFITYLQ